MEESEYFSHHICYTAAGRFDRINILLWYLLPRMAEHATRDSSQLIVGKSPAGFVGKPVVPVAQGKAIELLAGFQLLGFHDTSCLDQVPHGLLLLTGNPYRQ